MDIKNITKVSKNSQQNNLQTITNENNKKIPKERYYLQNKDKILLIILILI